MPIENKVCIGTIFKCGGMIGLMVEPEHYQNLVRFCCTPWFCFTTQSYNTISRIFIQDDDNLITKLSNVDYRNLWINRIAKTYRLDHKDVCNALFVIEHSYNVVNE